MSGRRRELRDGRASVRETYAGIVFKNERCGIGSCSGRVVLRATVFWPLDELMRRDAQFALVARTNPKGVHDNLVELRGSDGSPTPYIRHRVVYSCAKHARDLEQACSGRDVPSWCVVEFQRGPDEAPIMRGWSTELANSAGIALIHPDETEEGFRVTNRRHTSE